MKFGLSLGTSFRNWLPLTLEAELAGFESVWIPEHLIFPVTITGQPGTPHEGEPPVSAATPGWDVWVQIAWLAGQTSTIRFGTNVFNIGLRHPFITARAVTTVDLVSGGRLALGIGASWMSQEWEAMELPFASRGRRVDETIRIIQRLFTEEVVQHEGEFFHFPPVGFLPKPVQRPWPPMYIGGDSPAALRRAARMGDGWLPVAQTPETLPANLARLAELRKHAGRDGPFEVTIVLEPGEPSVDLLRRYEDLGVTRVVVEPWQAIREAQDGIRRFGENVVAQMDSQREP